MTRFWHLGPSRRHARGALMLLAGLLVASGALRITTDSGSATAAETAMQAPMSEPPAPQACETPEDLRRTLALFREREQKLTERETRLQDRMNALSQAEAEIDRRLAELSAAEAELRKLLTIADEAAEGDVAKLTQVYEAMKPKDAAPLFEAMDPDFAAGFLGRMRPEAAAGILAGLSPDTAYTISVVLAGRNASVAAK